MKTNSPYFPQTAKIIEIRPETSLVKSFRLSLDNEISFSPGEFIMLTIPGEGEFPLTPTSEPIKSTVIEVAVKKEGYATELLHEKRIGDVVGIRGPYGKGYPLTELSGRDLILIAQDEGIIQLHSLLMKILSDRSRFPRLTLLYEFLNDREVVYSSKFNNWHNEFIFYKTSSENNSSTKKGIDQLLSKIDLDFDKASAVIAAPESMIKKIALSLNMSGISSEQIWIPLVRNMSCGIGKCRHCITGDYYVCKDGPVFRLSDIYDTLGSIL
ncbi:MAG: hypothetical protein GX817_06565 [Elusimicrobia bacterium]|nr:hypothetical protein [Elusimicrobiota bacterium]